ncbi:fimbrillin family protein [Phocaeicola barnesiae]|uniref:Fimbrillin family protein n=1 Tax=Phocaeicola barnesiae TaxID=376804 RepID=A0AAW5N690_9BACT|nr:fimbrillin family protein [Phocaeicola barnesiae]MCR8874016.1 fimbrillin family protein [Phocaeicola barnesiae]
MKRNVLGYGIGVLALSVMLACNHEDVASGFPSAGQQAVLVAQKSHIITRAGDEVTPFKLGTKYLLYAVNQENVEVLNGEGTERDNHTIDYGTVISYGSSPISFYGATYGSTTKVPAFPSDGGTTITETVKDDGTLPDLMFSNNLIDQTVSNGYRLEMNFKHAMSKLKFRIVKQDETEDAEAEKKLENATLTKIQVKGTHGTGSLDIVNGTWTYAEDEEPLPDRTYYANATGMEVTTTSQEVPGEMLVFPNEANEQVTISVTLTGIGDSEGEKTVDYRLMEIDEEGEEDGNFQFEMNHEYTLLITVLKDEVRTIAIAPQVYDWIDEDRKYNYLGQPVTFANLMWMDRNLGAKSADCENDWEACRGYYYQYARNIPYILDKEKYDLAIKGSPKYEFLYTYNQYGEKVYGGLQAGSTKTLDDGSTIAVRTRQNIAVNPGDEGIYEFIYDNGSGVWMYGETGTNEDQFINDYWTQSLENHPCPKGWRLPTKEDFATFLPDYTFSTNPWYKGFHHPDPYPGEILKYQEEVIYGTVNGERAFYLIKRQGRDDCYRIRILLKSSIKDGIRDDTKQYYEFAYFSGDKTMSFKGINESNQEELNTRFDWQTPSSIMEIPAVGFIHPHSAFKLDGDGINAILRTSEYNETRGGYNWVFYLRNDYRFGLIDDSRKALGDQIRCVRDVTAK